MIGHRHGRVDGRGIWLRRGRMRWHGGLRPAGGRRDRRSGNRRRRAVSDGGRRYRHGNRHRQGGNRNRGVFGPIRARLRFRSVRLHRLFVFAAFRRNHRRLRTLRFVRHDGLRDAVVHRGQHGCFGRGGCDRHGLALLGQVRNRRLRRSHVGRCRDPWRRRWPIPMRDRLQRVSHVLPRPGEGRTQSAQRDGWRFVLTWHGEPHNRRRSFRHVGGRMRPFQQLWISAVRIRDARGLSRCRAGCRRRLDWCGHCPLPRHRQERRLRPAGAIALSPPCEYSCPTRVADVRAAKAATSSTAGGLAGLSACAAPRNCAKSALRSAGRAMACAPPGATVGNSRALRLVNMVMAHCPSLRCIRR